MKKNSLVYAIAILVLLSAWMFTCSGRLTQSGDPTAVPATLSGAQLLESIEKAFVDIAEQSNPAIVGITTFNIENRSLPWTQDRNFDRREGTGFVFRKEGYILTNDHVVNGAKEVNIRLFDQREFKAQIVGTDPSTDIAVLKIEAGKNLPILRLADSDGVKVGQFAIAIGNPFQLDYTVTAGIVSGKGRSLLSDSPQLIRYQDFIQTDAWINKGNSGGPLLNSRGEVIGINSLIRKADDTPAADVVRAGAGFAIPINLVKKISEQLIANGKVIRGWLGIGMEETSQGVRVTRVFSSTPAERGGLQRGDIITQYNQQSVRHTNEFKLLIAESPVGEQENVIILRQGVEQKLQITIGEMPPQRMGRPIRNDSESWQVLGLYIRELGKQDFERYAYLTPDDKGVIVGEVRVGAPGPSAGIPRGALIVAVNFQKILDTQTYHEVLAEGLDATEVTFEIKTAYSEGTETVVVKLGQE